MFDISDSTVRNGTDARTQVASKGIRLMKQCTTVVAGKVGQPQQDRRSG